VVWQADSGPDRLLWPHGLAVDRRGTLTIVDAAQDRLVHLAAGDGRVLAHRGGPGAAPGQFRFRTQLDADERGVVFRGAVAVDGAGVLYVVDPFNDRIQRLDPAGPVITAWGEPPAVGPLHEPIALAVDDRRGRVYVADAGANRVHAFDRDGHWLFAWGSHGQAAGEFLGPAAVAVDRQGRVYVADRLNDRIQVFDVGGRFVTAWGGPDAKPDAFWEPTGVMVDGAGRVYVATARRVLVFSDVGVFLAAWDGPGGGAADRFGALGGIAVDEQGAVYVADQIPVRVLKFRPRGPWPTPAAAQPIARPATPTATTQPLRPLPTLVPMTPTDR
jgi:DNA-binding beta-propeller fold protein YncE